MNDKESELYHIIDTCRECCEVDGRLPSRESVLGKSRKEELVWIRCIIVTQMLQQGYLTSTISRIMRRAPSSVRHLIVLDNLLRKSSRAYMIASEECDRRLS